MYVCARVKKKNYEVEFGGNLRTCIDEATNFSGSKFFFLLLSHSYRFTFTGSINLVLQYSGREIFLCCTRMWLVRCV